jgi:DNA-binding response OmpR family regulator
MPSRLWMMGPRRSPAAHRIASISCCSTSRCPASTASRSASGCARCVRSCSSSSSPPAAARTTRSAVLSPGADDYVTKPFGARELLARIEALSRRARREAPAPEHIEADGCRLDLGRCLAVRAESSISLTAREARILRLLYTNRARAISRAELLERVWGASGRLQTRTVDMTIANLRQKIERDVSEPRIVVTVKGVGYAWGQG